MTMKATGNSPLKHTSRITLYRDSRRIDIRNEINENFDGTHTWGFTFNLENSRRPARRGRCGNSRQTAGRRRPVLAVMSRLEWLTLNHFVDMSGEDGAGVTLSNSDCAFMKLGNSYIARRRVVSGHLDAANSGARRRADRRAQAGIAKQGGDRTSCSDSRSQTHGGYEPVRGDEVLARASEPAGCSVAAGRQRISRDHVFVADVSNPNVLLWALKPAEEGPAAESSRGFGICRGATQAYSLSLATGIASAMRVTHIETDIEAIPVAPAASTSRIAAIAAPDAAHGARRR